MYVAVSKCENAASVTFMMPLAQLSAYCNMAWLGLWTSVCTLVSWLSLLGIGRDNIGVCFCHLYDATCPTVCLLQYGRFGPWTSVCTIVWEQNTGVVRCLSRLERRRAALGDGPLLLLTGR